MRLKHRWWSGLVAALLGGLLGVTAVAAGAQFLPVLGAREGALKAQQLPLANGFIAYLTLLNERDGGINGLQWVWEECTTVLIAHGSAQCSTAHFLLWLGTNDGPYSGNGKYNGSHLESPARGAAR